MIPKHKSYTNYSYTQKYDNKYYRPWDIPSSLPIVNQDMSEIFNAIYYLERKTDAYRKGSISKNHLHIPPEVKEYTVYTFKIAHKFLKPEVKQDMRKVFKSVGIRFPDDADIKPPPIEFHKLDIYKNEINDSLLVPFCFTCEHIFVEQLGVLVLTKPGSKCPLFPRFDSISFELFMRFASPTGKSMSLSDFLTAIDKASINEIRVLDSPKLTKHIWYVHDWEDLDMFDEQTALIACQKLDTMPRIEAINLLKHFKKTDLFWHDIMNMYWDNLCRREATYRFYSHHARVIQNHFRRVIKNPSHPMGQNSMMYKYVFSIYDE